MFFLFLDEEKPLLVELTIFAFQFHFVFRVELRIVGQIGVVKVLVVVVVVFVVARPVIRLLLMRFQSHKCREYGVARSASLIGSQRRRNGRRREKIRKDGNMSL